MLGVVIARCAALEQPRDLISFDEAHSIAAEAEEAVNSLVSAVTSSVLGGAARSETDETTTPTTSPVSITITIGASNTADSTEEEDSASAEDTETETTAPATGASVDVTLSTQGSDGGESYSSTNAPATRAPTTTTPVSMTKRPTTRRPRTTTPSTVYASSTDDEESRAESGATAPSAAPATTTPTTSVLTQTPTTTVLTQAPATAVLTESPVVSVATESPVVSTETPATAVATTAPATLLPDETTAPSTATTESASGATPESGVIDDQTDAPVTDASSSTDAVVILPDESTVIPLETTAAPAAGTGSSDDWSGSAGQAIGSPAESPASSLSGGSNDTVVPDDSSEASSDGGVPGQVHASSSAAVDSSEGSSDSGDSSSSTHEAHKKREKRKKENNTSSASSTGSSSSGKSATSSSSDSGSSGPGSDFGAILNPGGVSDVNTSSATYYSLGTGSIVAIVGVIAGVFGILVLFVAIGRKKYTDEDDESPLPYGYNMEIRSVARLSPTFMQEDSFMESDFNVNNTALMVPVHSMQFDGASSSSGESADEVPSLRGNTLKPHMDDVSIRSRVPSVQSFSGDLNATGGRMSSLYSGSSGSGISGSWSSVLASDTERQPSRNTRDTSLSGWSAANLSSFGSTASGGSAFRMTRSSTMSTDLRQTGGSDRSTGPPSAYPTTTDVESNRSNKSTEV